MNNPFLKLLTIEIKKCEEFNKESLKRQIQILENILNQPLNKGDEEYYTSKLKEIQSKLKNGPVIKINPLPDLEFEEVP